MRTVVQFVFTGKEQNKAGRPKKAKKGRKARPVPVDASPSNPDSLEFQPNVCSTSQRTQWSDSFKWFGARRPKLSKTIFISVKSFAAVW